MVAATAAKPQQLKPNSRPSDKSQCHEHSTSPRLQLTHSRKEELILTELQKLLTGITNMEQELWAATFTLMPRNNKNARSEG